MPSRPGEEIDVFPTFVIGLREGLEATLLVGIVAAFLAQHDRRVVLPKIWIATAIALTLSAAAGVVLQVISADLAPRPQERFETVVGFAAVAMVTWMIVHLRSQARDVQAGLAGDAAATFEKGSERALVTMVFFGVLREGIEMVVFVLAAFHAEGNGFQSGSGVVLGLVVAVVGGYAIYRGGLRIDLNRFFRITGLALVVIAAGLVMTALRTGYSSGWINFGQQQILDLNWLVPAGTLRASLLTGTFGVQSSATRIEVLAWIAYVVPMALVVCWPRRVEPIPLAG